MAHRASSERAVYDDCLDPDLAPKDRVYTENSKWPPREQNT